MQKMILTTVVCALVFAALPTTTTAAEAPMITVSNGGDFTTATDHMQVCNDQLAVLVIDLPGCSFDDDVLDGWGFMTIGFTLNTASNGAIPFTGTTTAHLTWANGEVVFSCDWENGQWVQLSCRIAPGAAWPNLGAGFSFDCYSEAGALGHWGDCFVDHF